MISLDFFFFLSRKTLFTVIFCVFLFVLNFSVFSIAKSFTVTPTCSTHSGTVLYETNVAGQRIPDV